MLGRKWKGHVTGEGGIGSKSTLGGRSFLQGQKLHSLRNSCRKRSVLYFWITKQLEAQGWQELCQTRLCLS